MADTEERDTEERRDEQAREREQREEPREVGRETRAEPSARRDTPFTQQVGRVIIGTIAILFGIFAAANVQAVDFNWLPGVDAPDVSLIVLLIISFAAGAAIAWLATLRSSRRRNR